MADAGETLDGEVGRLPDEVTDQLDDDPDIVTVSQLSQELESLVANSGGVHHDYIVGDIADPSASSSNHLYFTLEGEDCKLQCGRFTQKSTSGSYTQCVKALCHRKPRRSEERQKDRGHLLVR